MNKWLLALKLLSLFSSQKLPPHLKELWHFGCSLLGWLDTVEPQHSVLLHLDQYS